jgi:dTMP kinase
MNPTGKFIVIEGPDGSGKGTQQEILVGRLRKSGIPVVTVDFPQYETSMFGKMAGGILSGTYGPIRDIHPMMASVVYAADRWRAKPFIVQSLSEGKVVIGNRYVLSNMAHQSSRLPREDRLNFIQEIDDMEFSDEGFGIPRPDLNIVLSVAPEISRELIAEKTQRSYLQRGMPFDQLEADIGHQMEAASMYKELAESLPGITLVECCNAEGVLMSRETIHELVWQEAYKVVGPELQEGSIRGEREG